MTIFLHELRRNRISLCIWSAAISFMLAVCVFIYPEMEAQMAEMGDMFANMGSFSDALGMENLNIGEFMGFFALECGEMLGLGGAIFAAILGAGILSKEEKGRTADLLLSHPISRTRVVGEKILAVMAEITILNAATFIITCISVLAIGEELNIKLLGLIFLAFLILQFEIAAISIGVSSVVIRGGAGIGIGVTVLFYFLNLISNLTESLEFFKYITPYGYADGGAILNDEAINIKYLVIGLAIAALCIALAFIRYRKKDIK